MNEINLKGLTGYRQSPAATLAALFLARQRGLASAA